MHCCFAPVLQCISLPCDPGLVSPVKDTSDVSSSLLLSELLLEVRVEGDLPGSLAPASEELDFGSSSEYLIAEAL